MIDEQKLTTTFFDLVTIDSPSGEEEMVRDYIVKRLKRIGINSRIDKTGNLFAKSKGIGEPVVLSAHMDTVEPGREIKPRILGGVVKSDGRTILGADDKVAVAAILEAIESVDLRKRKSLEIIFSVREETDGGINYFNFNKIKAKYGILADRSSPVGTIVYTSPWIVNLKIKIIGKTAHAGMPERGINALTIASAAISKLRWGRIDQKTTANIGIIRGGSAMNSVPGEVELIGEVRSFSKESLEKTINQIRKGFESEVGAASAGLQFKRELYCPGYVYKKSDKAVKRVIEANKKVGVKTSYTLSFGGSDANTFIANGIDVVNVGDGSVNPHTVKESISVKNLVKLTELFKAYIEAN